MKLLAQLEAEHRLIEQVVGSLRQWRLELAAGRADGSDLHRFARFLRSFSGHFHHGREDDVLIAALVESTDLPPDSPPLAVIADEHRRSTELAEELARAAESGPTPEDAAALEAPVEELAHLLWEHIDKEDSVLFPESQRRLEQYGIHELPVRPMSDEEAAARAEGEALVERYSPLEDTDMVRGAGCVICSAFGSRCRGIEAEWWNRWHWDHFRSLDE